ncbi:MAG TPA: hypothetical protein VGS80_14200 [Ktedonobacterales bacterium]|nr:hypothetical protein [Ktedonobacterales bacterium]
MRHDLRLPPRQRRPLCFEGGQGGVLVIQAHRLRPLVPGITPLGQQMVVQPATFLTLVLKAVLLGRGRLEAVRDWLTHASIIA